MRRNRRPLDGNLGHSDRRNLMVALSPRDGRGYDALKLMSDQRSSTSTTPLLTHRKAWATAYYAASLLGQLALQRLVGLTLGAIRVRDAPVVLLAGSRRCRLGDVDDGEK